MAFWRASTTLAIFLIANLGRARWRVGRGARATDGRSHNRAGGERMTASSKTVQTGDIVETLSAVQRSPSAAALRMRRHRLRRQSGLRCLIVEVREREIDALGRVDIEFTAF